ncbi:MAG: 3-deoxy-D-manno-octulosonic acid transferase [Thermodesulfobacteriota bacterium]|nr:3-deoxy-D-manno-octulosonic acid transferase [Thermodesulfobacteriota bacterium]
MVYLLYDIVVWLTALFLVPCYLVRGVLRGKVRCGIRERLGFFNRDRFVNFSGKQVFWIHAVSVGETRAAIPLIKALRVEYPQAVLLLSNVTETGHAIAQGIKEIDDILFFPLDASRVVRRVLRRINPNHVLIVETELWPNFIRQCYRMDIPIQLVNGRISDRSFPRYLRAKRFVRPLLELLSGFCMQSPLDAQRIAVLGAPQQRILVTGNLKFDMQSTLPPDLSAQQLKEEFLLDQRGRIWVAGSTHSGEEDQVIQVFQRLLVNHPDLMLILVPRHPERCKAVAELLNNANLTWHLRSQQEEQILCGGGVLLVDTIGEMLKFYRMAELVFVGGSLVPTGGHNILEASLLKKAVLFGSNMHNFREIAALVQQAQGAGRVHDADELYRLVDTLLDEPQQCTMMGEQGWLLLQKNVGASHKTLNEISRCVHN